MSDGPRIVHCDSATLPGSHSLFSARPSQDYALHGRLKLGADEMAHYAIVSDGCSSAGNTDLGARRWTHSLNDVLAEIAQEGSLFATTLNLSAQEPGSLRMRVLDKALELKLHSLRRGGIGDDLATLGVVVSSGGMTWAKLWGDGVIVSQDLDGATHIACVTFGLNAPLYLAYELDARESAGVPADTVELGGATLPLSKWRNLMADELVKVETFVCDAAGCVKHAGTQAFAATSFLEFSLMWGPQSSLRSVAVLTDGVASLGDTSLSEVVRECLAVKNTSGSFLRRRLGSMARGWRKSLRWPDDDLSAAGLWFSVEAPNA